MFLNKQNSRPIKENYFKHAHIVLTAVYNFIKLNTQYRCNIDHISSSTKWSLELVALLRIGYFRGQAQSEPHPFWSI